MKKIIICYLKRLITGLRIRKKRTRDVDAIGNIVADKILLLYEDGDRQLMIAERDLTVTREEKAAAVERMKTLKEIIDLTCKKDA